MTDHPAHPGAPAAHPHPAPGGASGRNRRRFVGGLLAVLALGGAAAGFGLLGGFASHKPAAGDPTASGFAETPAARAAQTVKVVRPKRDPSLEVAVEQLCVVEPYFRADLKTRVSGVVRAVRKDLGDKVRRGEVLVEVDVPELEQEVAQKEGVVEQRRQELRVARANHDNALAVVEVARAAVRQRQAELAQAESTREFRRRRLARLTQMAGRDTVVANVVDEEEKEYKAAAAGVDGAAAAIEKAEADLTEKASSVKAAQADIDLKAAIVEVARRDLERSRAVAAYARVTAPFDGVVVRRNVDPGAFVQNATSGQSEPLLTVARTDLMTVVGRFPDSAAPFIGEGTLATITLADLPGKPITARVSRFAPAIQASDRTVRVEVDLYNAGPAEFARLLTRVAVGEAAPLAAPHPLAALVLAAAGQSDAEGLHKGTADDLPAPAALAGGRLVAGMTGAMRLRLSEFDDTFVVPGRAVYARAGKPYLLLVEGGRTREVPARVQVTDGSVAKVGVAVAGPGGREAYRDLTGDELVVVSRQQEVGDGRAVVPTATDW